MITRRIVPLVAVVTLSCATDPTVLTFAGAYARASCGPADGPAMVVELSVAPQAEPLSPPLVRLYIQQSRADAAGRTWTLGPAAGASAAYCADQGGCEEAVSGSVQFDPITATDTQSGAFGATFPARGRVTGTFRARWNPTPALCG